MFSSKISQWVFFWPCDLWRHYFLAWGQSSTKSRLDYTQGKKLPKGLSSPISTRGKLKMFLKSSRATLLCFLNLLVVICSALDLQDDGKWGDSCCVYMAGIFMVNIPFCFFRHSLSLQKSHYFQSCILEVSSEKVLKIPRSKSMLKLIFFLLYLIAVRESFDNKVVREFILSSAVVVWYWTIVIFLRRLKTVGPF